MTERRDDLLGRDLARTRGVWLGLMFAAAALLSPLTLAVPHGPGYDIAGLLAVTVAAAVIAVALLTRNARLSAGRAHAVVAAGSLLTAAVIHFTGGLPNAATLFFVWIVLFAFYFFEPRPACAHLAFVLILYVADALLTDSPYSLAANAIATAGALTGAAGIVGALRRRILYLLAKLGETARTDELTGLPNRRAFNEELARALARSARSEDPLSLCVLDLDRFKDVNDRFGHQVGDEVLAHAAEVIRISLREGDMAARFGGEEFAALLPATDSDTAYAVAERIRASVADAPARPGLRVTVSIGTASAAAKAERDASDLLRRADRALYAAKHAGRDRVMGDEARSVARS
jgi:diguanylate cyclase (GGDEF)-like protein